MAGTMGGSSGSGSLGGAIGSGGATGKGGAGGTGGDPRCSTEATDAAVPSGCHNNSQCPANQYCDTQHCGSSCSCVGGSWMCTNVCVFSCVPYATTDGAASAPQDAAPVTVVIVPGLKTYNPAMSSVPGFPFTPLASGSVPANPLYRWRTDYGTFALWNHSDGKVTDQGSDFAVGDTTVYLEYLTAPSDMSIPVRIQLDLVDGIGGELLASDELSLGWTLPATLTVAGSSGSGGSGGAIGSGGATGKGGAGGTGGAPECEATDAAVESGCANNSQCPANQYCDTQHCGSSCSCVGGYWLCTDVCRFSCVPYAANDGPPYLPQDAAPVTVAIEPGLTKWGPYMSSVPGFPFKHWRDPRS